MDVFDLKFVLTWILIIVFCVVCLTSIVYTAFSIFEGRMIIVERPIDTWTQEVKMEDTDPNDTDIYYVKYHIEYRDGVAKEKWKTVDKETYEEVQNALVSGN